MRLAVTSDRPQQCSCHICDVGRMNGQEYVQYVNSVTNRPGAPSKKGDANSIPSQIKVCSQCLSEISAGKEHKCTHTTNQQNLVKLLSQSSPTTQQKVTTKSLDNLYEMKGVKKGETVQLTTMGRDIQVTLGKPSEKKLKPMFSHDDLIKLQVSQNMTNNDILAVGGMIRVITGRKNVEVGFKGALKENNNKMRELFTGSEETFKEKPKVDKNKTMTGKCKTEELSTADNIAVDENGCVDKRRP